MPIHIVRKPIGITSHDVVAAGRKAFRTRAVGHAGTLDPLAAGVLVLLTGADTKLSPHLTASEKRYYAWIALGASTPTLDAEGPLLPGNVALAMHVGAADITAQFSHFLALTSQVPPAFSAVQHGGERSYDRARRGEHVKLPPRHAGYTRLELLHFGKTLNNLPLPAGVNAEDLPAQLGEFPIALIDVHVKAGTYVRAFARDLGERLGTGAHLAGLVRYQAGAAHLSEAVALPDLASDSGAQAYDVLHLPKRIISQEIAERTRLGQRPKLVVNEKTALFTDAHELVALVEPHPDNPRRIQFIRVFPAS